MFVKWMNKIPWPNISSDYYLIPLLSFPSKLLNELSSLTASLCHSADQKSSGLPVASSTEIHPLQLSSKGSPDSGSKFSSLLLFRQFMPQPIWIITSCLTETLHLSPPSNWHLTFLGHLFPSFLLAKILRGSAQMPHLPRSLPWSPQHNVISFFVVSKAFSLDLSFVLCIILIRLYVILITPMPTLDGVFWTTQSCRELPLWLTETSLSQYVSKVGLEPDLPVFLAPGHDVSPCCKWVNSWRSGTRSYFICAPSAPCIMLCHV